MIKTYAQTGKPSSLSFDPVKPGFSITREDVAIGSCILSFPLVTKGSEPIRLVQTGDSLGVKLGLSYRPWSGPYVPVGPRVMFCSSPWEHDQISGKFTASAESLGKMTSHGWILGQHDEIANFWVRPLGGKSWPSSTKDGNTAGTWPQSILRLKEWKGTEPVEMIFSLTRLEGGKLRYYGYCAGVEHESVMVEQSPFNADFLWLNLSTPNAKEVRVSTLLLMTP